MGPALGIKVNFILVSTYDKYLGIKYDNDINYLVGDHNVFFWG